MSFIDVVVVNWNAGNQLRECVDSIIGYGHALVSNIIVVDNGSVDGSADTVLDLSLVTLLRAGTNLGFGKACNLGAEHVDSEYILFLNPDACLFPNSLPDTFAFMQEELHAQIGICGVQLLDESGSVARSCARFPSVKSFTISAIGVNRFLPKFGQVMAEWNHNHTREVDQVIGAFFLVRRELFLELGGFDERFFVYYEEVDFAFRARCAGWRSVYFAGAQAFHSGGGTSNQIKARRLFYSLRSRLLYVFKHFSKGNALVVMLATLFIEPITRTVHALLQGSWAGVKEVWSAYGTLFYWLPQWVLKGVTR